MAPFSQNENVKIYESQIRECYGRVVYSHKIHEKCADICHKWLNRIKFWQIVLSVITSGSFLSTILGSGKVSLIIGALASAILLFLNLYAKNYALGQLDQKHKDAADKLWNVREYYLSLLTDIAAEVINFDEIRIRRDHLQKELSSIYTGALRTNSAAYKEAQKALKKLEDMTFSDEEIDAFLPKSLRRSQIC